MGWLANKSWVWLLLVGAVVYGALNSQLNITKIQLPPIDETQLRYKWNSVAGANFSPAQWHRLRQDERDQQILQHQAIELGLHKTDAVVVRRLKQLQLYLADESGSLALEQTDLVVRRRLVQLMEEHLVDANTFEISDVDVDNYYAANSRKFTSPIKISFSHYFFNDSNKALATVAEVLVKQGRPAADAFLAGNGFNKVGQKFVNETFGSGFYGQLNMALLHQWQGPIKSAFGHHWVNINAIYAAKKLALADVKKKIITQLYEARRKEVITAQTIKLRDRYSNGWVTEVGVEDNLPLE